MVVNFDIQATAGFSLTNAKVCAEASRLAYVLPGRGNDPDGATRISSGINHAVCFKTQCVDEEVLIVAFRGTANIRDWMTDADFRMINHVHCGFHRAFDSIAVELLDYLSEHQGKPVIFTGHSLGGAQAVLAAWAFAQHHPGSQVYTFGQPRVGDAFFAAQCKEKFGDSHFRFVNQEDIVPRVPAWLQGYRHSGQELFFSSLALPLIGIPLPPGQSWAGNLRMGAPIWLKLISDIYGSYLDYKAGKLAQIADHSIANYIHQLSIN